MQFLSRQNIRIAALALLTKVLVISFGVHSYMVTTDLPIGNVYKILYIWKRWDALHYLKIAAHGYTNSGEDRFLLVFFPLYPLLVSAFDLVFEDAVLSAFLVSGAASVALCVLFRELVRLDYPERVAQMSVLMLLIFPTSFYLHIPYTESLFLALTVGSFLAARKRRWLLAGLLGLLACTTRINGLILLPALIFEAWDEYRENRKISKQWLYLLLIPLGVSLYLGLNYYVSGNPFKFLEYHREHWHKYLRLPWEAILVSLKATINRPPAQMIMVGFQELFFVAVGLAGIVIGWRGFRASYRTWMVINWLLFVSTSFLLGVPRYTLTMFPIFIVMGVYSHRDRLLNAALTVGSVLLLAFFITEFVQGKWVF